MNLKANKPLVTVYVVTCRRPQLLMRALRGLVSQTNSHWIAYVVNDAPNDGRVGEIIQTVRDARIQLYDPVMKRGAAANFNLAFEESSTPFASILEDDNWWEPDFLHVMISALEKAPKVDLVCGNERIWQESASGKWLDTGKLIWPEQKDSFYTTSFETACGSAKLCNSSMLFRAGLSAKWQTPDDIPVDVTEHFRERLVTQPIQLVAAPLVNYAETMHTHRSQSGSMWGDYQCLLIGSCFYSLPSILRTEFAHRLWSSAGMKPSPRATSLLTTSLAVREARCLWTNASAAQRARFFATVVRRISGIVQTLSIKKRLKPHWEFLCRSCFNGKLANTKTNVEEE